MTSGNSVRLDFQSSLSMLDFVQMVSDHISRMVGLDDDSVHWVSVAVRESVINAIKHGNRNDAQKRVHVEFTSLQDGDGRSLAVRVRDEGCGFDPSSLARRTSRELDLCGDAIPLLLEPNGYGAGERPIFALDIMNPCWIYKGADLSRGDAEGDR